MANNDATSANESSASEHLASLRQYRTAAIIRMVGGNAASPQHEGDVEVGESTYTESGCFLAARGLVFTRNARRARGCRSLAAGAFAAMLVVGLQTDVIGFRIAVVVWALVAEVSRRSTVSQTIP
jgi:hypothetical protein